MRNQVLTQVFKYGEPLSIRPYFKRENSRSNETDLTQVWKTALAHRERPIPQHNVSNNHPVVRQ